MTDPGTSEDVAAGERLVEQTSTESGRATFVARLNQTLPRTRLIAQGLVRDDAGRVLLCELTYKREWDLPGGVVDPHESPADTLARELEEELGLTLPVGPLLAVNWLPPYREWDDALLLVFDLGTHPDLLERVRLQRRELRAVHWCAPEDLAAHVAPYVHRHLAHLLDDAGPPAPVPYLEDGTPRPHS